MPATETATRLERRVVPMELRLERRQKDRAPHLVGHAAVFNRRSVDLGGFIEIIKPGAFRTALETSDTRALWNHNSDLPLGRRRPGVRTNTLQLEEDAIGLKVDIDPPKSATFYIESVERGDVSNMSFAFWVDDSKVTWETLEDGTLLRTIHEDGIAELPDVSPVTYPAYPDTDVALRTAERIRRGGAGRGAGRARPADRRPPEVVRLELERERLQLIRDELAFDERLITALGPRSPARRQRPVPELPSRAEWMLARERAGLFALKLAQHEAAHAVAYYLAGAGVRRIELEWVRRWDGSVSIESGFCRARRPHLIGGPEIAAGEAWEILMGWTIGLDNDRGLESDRRQLVAWLQREGRLIIRGREIVKAQGILCEHCRAVQTLGHELLERIQLSGERAEAIIQENLGLRARTKVLFPRGVSRS